MRFFDYYRSKKVTSAKSAKERLQIIIAHERIQTSGHEYLPILQKELLDVIRKYIPVSEEAVKIDLDREGACEILEINVILPQNEEQGKTPKRPLRLFGRKPETKGGEPFDV